MEKKIAEKPSGEIAPERLIQSGRAVADLAHLAKNILQVLSGCSEIIDLALATNQIDRINRAWQLFQPCFWRLKKFQLDLIKFTKSYSLNVQPCELKSLAANAAKQMEPIFAHRHVSFSLRISDNLPSLTADGEKLCDTLFNLLVTAVDNLEDKPGQVSLNASLTESGNVVQIEVSDSGPILSADMCDALLTPHERCRNMLGTGLEIPLAIQIAEAHRGKLFINPDSTDGNVLVLELPVTL